MERWKFPWKVPSPLQGESRGREAAAQRGSGGGGKRREVIGGFSVGFFGDFKRKDFNSGLACHGLTSVFD